MRQREKGQGLEQDLKPEQKAREEIDKLLSLAGFELRDFKDYALGVPTVWSDRGEKIFFVSKWGGKPS